MADDITPYHAWKDAPPGPTRDTALTRLMEHLGGVVASAINTYRAAPLPQLTLELEGKRQAVEAIKEWNPALGTSLGSFVGQRVRQRLYRYVAEHQNVARIPEHEVRRIGGFQRGVAFLTDQLGRDPTTEELADHLGVPPHRVTKLRKLFRKDLLESSFEAPEVEHDADYERAMLAYYGLTDQEKLVFDFSLGAHGQPRLSGNDIAKRLSVAPSRVSALKESIATKLKPYLGAP